MVRLTPLRRRYEEKEGWGGGYGRRRIKSKEDEVWCG
jgi:hypothetical protein